MANQWLSWLPFLPADVPADFASPREVAAFELAQALPTLSPNLHVSLARMIRWAKGSMPCAKATT